MVQSVLLEGLGGTLCASVCGCNVFMSLENINCVFTAMSEVVKTEVEGWDIAGVVVFVNMELTAVLANAESGRGPSERYVWDLRILEMNGK